MFQRREKKVCYEIDRISLQAFFQDSFAWSSNFFTSEENNKNDIKLDSVEMQGFIVKMSDA